MCCIIPHRRKVDILIEIYGIMLKEYVFGEFEFMIYKLIFRAGH